jgi:hypothetical protein
VKEEGGEKEPRPISCSPDMEERPERAVECHSAMHWLCMGCLNARLSSIDATIHIAEKQMTQTKREKREKAKLSPILFPRTPRMMDPREMLYRAVEPTSLS